MGQLPESRVTPSIGAFLNVGMDHCGLFPSVLHKKPGAQANGKSWLLIFICLNTKAIHLEVSTDMSSTSCVAAMERCFTREGTPHTIWSDNSTKFIGAYTMIQKAEKDGINQSENEDDIETENIK
jgi:hypothetical protein